MQEGGAGVEGQLQQLLAQWRSSLGWLQYEAESSSMPPVPRSSPLSSLCPCRNRRGISAAAKNVQQNCTGGSLGARVGVYKRKNG